MKKWIFVFIVATNVFGGRLDLRCWDSTFSYDSFRIQDRDDGVEIALGGHFFSYRDMEIGSAPNYGFRVDGMKLNIKFKNSACTSLLSNNVYCKASGTLQNPVKVFPESVYIDLGNYITIIPDVSLMEVELAFDGKKLSVNFTDLYLIEKDRVTQNIQIEANDCEDDQFTPTFSERVRAYLGNVNDSLSTHQP